MRAIFLMIKAEPGEAYEVAAKIAETEQASEVYSIAGNYDLLVKCYVEKEDDIGRFVSQLIKQCPGIRDTNTIITHRAF